MPRSLKTKNKVIGTLQTWRLFWSNKRDCAANAEWDRILTEEREKQDSLFVKWYDHRAKTMPFSDEEIGDRLKELKEIVQEKKNEINRTEVARLKNNA